MAYRAWFSVATDIEYSDMVCFMIDTCTSTIPAIYEFALSIGNWLGIH
jgi:hypothetical protein